MSNGPTGREWGEHTREVTEVRHDLRQLKMIVDNQTEMIRKLEMKANSLNTRIYTAISVGAVFISAIAFVLQMVIRIVG